MSDVGLDVIHVYITGVRLNAMDNRVWFMEDSVSRRRLDIWLCCVSPEEKAEIDTCVSRSLPPF